MRAVLMDAFDCFHKRVFSPDHRVQQIAREAEEWFFIDDHHWLFSFVHICLVLGLDPDYIRRGLRRWRQASTSTVPQKEPHVSSAHHRAVVRVKALS